MSAIKDCALPHSTKVLWSLSTVDYPLRTLFRYLYPTLVPRLAFCTPQSRTTMKGLIVSGLESFVTGAMEGLVLLLSPFRPSSCACCCFHSKYNPSKNLLEPKPFILTPTGQPAQYVQVVVGGGGGGIQFNFNPGWGLSLERGLARVPPCWFTRATEHLTWGLGEEFGSNAFRTSPAQRLPHLTACPRTYTNTHKHEFLHGAVGKCSTSLRTP